MLSVGCLKMMCLLGFYSVCLNTVCSCVVGSVMAACSYGKSCSLATDASMTRVRIICARVFVCVWMHNRDSVSVSLMHPGLLTPEADHASWQLSAPRRTVHLLRYSTDLQTPSPGADIWRLSVRQTGRTMQRSLANLCSVQMWKHLIHVFWCHFFMSLVLQFFLLVHYDEIKARVFRMKNVLPVRLSLREITPDSNLVVKQIFIHIAVINLLTLATLCCGLPL